MRTRILLAAMLFIPATAFAGSGEQAQPMSQVDQNRDGKVSTEEFTQHARDKFRRADTNNDGNLDQNEFQQMATQRMGQEQRRGRMGQPEQQQQHQPQSQQDMNR